MFIKPARGRAARPRNDGPISPPGSEKAAECSAAWKTSDVSSCERPPSAGECSCTALFRRRRGLLFVLDQAAKEFRSGEGRLTG